MSLPKTMKAIVTVGQGGYDKLEYRDVPVPQPQAGEVLLRVLAAGMNNTEINTRLGWYSSDVSGSTDATATDAITDEHEDGGWSGKTPFPLIQGTDCCGEVVALGKGAATGLLGKRVLVRACMRLRGFDDLECEWMASNFDGAFAQFVKVPASEVFAVDCGWSDAELATIPCAYATAETMLHRAQVGSEHHVLVAGASGGVGSAVVQLAKARGARVTALTSKGKMQQLLDLGAHRTVDRNEDLVSALGEFSVDVVIDNVGGAGFPAMLKVLKRGGRLATSGAIAGPIVDLDMRDLYLKDISLIGSTAWDEMVFPWLVQLIEAGTIKPLLDRTYPLDQIVVAQEEFLLKRHFGNFVLIPPSA
jgi:NADPH:quinone reductase-like Zn-dependent oxidoreductase